MSTSVACSISVFAFLLLASIYIQSFSETSLLLIRINKFRYPAMPLPACLLLHDLAALWSIEPCRS